MSVRNFLEFATLKEVECSGATLRTEVTFLSLTLFKVEDQTMLAHMLTSTKTCNTFAEFASCSINVADSTKSVVKTLLADLNVGERVLVGCNVTSVLANGHAQMFSWSIAVEREREFVCFFKRKNMYLF